MIYMLMGRSSLYHTYGFRYYNGNEFDLCSYLLPLSDEVLKWIYLPYPGLQLYHGKIRKVDKDFCQPTKEPFIRNYFHLEANENTDESLPNICTLLSKDYLIQGLAFYCS